jgi:acetyl esterase/lipase
MTWIRFNNRGRIEVNYHDWRTGKGVMIRGPKFDVFRLHMHAPTTAYRFIFYFPSGAWWHFDITFDRRNSVTRKASEESNG